MILYGVFDSQSTIPGRCQVLLSLVVLSTSLPLGRLRRPCLRNGLSFATGRRFACRWGNGETTVVVVRRSMRLLWSHVLETSRKHMAVGRNPLPLVDR